MPDPSQDPGETIDQPSEGAASSVPPPDRDATRTMAFQPEPAEPEPVEAEANGDNTRTIDFRPGDSSDQHDNTRTMAYTPGGDDDEATRTMDLAPGGSSGSDGGKPGGKSGSSAKARSASARGGTRPGHKVIATLVPGVMENTRYTVTRLHAEGGLGKVWVASDGDLNREVVLKELRPQQAGRNESMKRFLKEAQITGQLEHPNIVPIYELGYRPSDGQPFYTMRFVRGQTLKDIVREYHAHRRAGKVDPLELPRLLGAFVAICNAVAYAHARQVIHRDLKPANVALGEFGEVIVLDWGLAKVMGEPDEATTRQVAISENADTEATYEGNVMGTPGYMAPEQAEGRIDAIGPAADIYGLGAILFEILVGEAPHRGQNTMELLQRIVKGDVPKPRNINPTAPAALDAVCAKAMALSAGDRYATASDLAEDVQRWLADEPVGAYPEPWYDRTRRWVRKHRTLVASTAAAAALLLVAVGMWNWRESSRLGRLREEGQQLVRAGQAALSRDDLDDARVQLTSAASLVADEASLADLKTDAEALLAQTDAALGERAALAAARDKLAQFALLRDKALFHGTLFTGIDVAANLQAAREAAGGALGLFELGPTEGLASSVGFAEQRFLTPEEQRQIVEGNYELLLVLAEATSQPPPAVSQGGDDGETAHDDAVAVDNAPNDNAAEDNAAEAPDPAALAAEALTILARSDQLGIDTRAVHLRRAKYLSAAGDAGASADELARAEETPLSTAMDFFLVGDEEYKAGNLAAAIGHFDGALRQAPDHFWAHYFLAVCHLKQGAPREAIAHLTASLSQRPDFGWIYMLRAFAYGEAGDYAAAHEDFQVAERMLPADYGFFVNRGAVHIRQGNLDAAEKDLLAAVELRPDQFQAYANLAEVYRQRKEYAKARRQLTLAIRRARDVATPYRVRAQILADEGELEAAAEDYALAVRYGTPGSRALAEDQLERGRLLRRLERLEDALAAYDAAAEADPTLPLVHRLRAEVLMRLNRREEALAAFDTYLDPGEIDPDAFRQRALERQLDGDAAGALSDYTRALELEPDSPLARGRRGWALLNNSAQLALADFDAAIALEPENGDVYNGRGYARTLLGQYREGVADAEKALELSSGIAEVRQQLTLRINAACVFAQAAGRAEMDLASSDHAQLSAQYETRALELLRSALALLPENLRGPYLQQATADPAFDPIRHREGFGEYLQRSGGEASE